MQNEIRGIDIKNLIWKMVFGWKYILIVGLLFSILMIGYKYKSDLDAYNVSQSIEAEIDESEIKNLASLLSLYDRLNYYENYYEDSLVVKLNPQEYYILELQYYIDSEYVFEIEQGAENDYTPAIVSAYGAYVLNNEFAELLRNELFKDSSVQSIRELTQVVADGQSSTIKLVISVPNNSDAREMEKAIDTILSDKCVELNNIGEHKIEKVNSAINVSFSDALERKIYESRNNINSTRQSIESLKTNLTDAQKVYIYNNLPYEEYKSEFLVASPEKPSINAKFAVVGFIIGAFLTCAYYLVKEVFSNKLQNTDDIQAVFGVRKLGVVDNKSTSKRTFILDKILYNIKNKNRVVLTREEQISYIISCIEIVCKSNQINSVSLLGSLKKCADVETMEEIASMLKNKGITCDIIGNITSDGQQLKKAVEIGNVILTEEINKSYYKYIEEEIKVLREYDIKILGTIIVV